MIHDIISPPARHSRRRTHVPMELCADPLDAAVSRIRRVAGHDVMMTSDAIADLSAECRTPPRAHKVLTQSKEVYGENSTTSAHEFRPPGQATEDVEEVLTGDTALMTREVFAGK